jgi:hypothetical protein
MGLTNCDVIIITILLFIHYSIKHLSEINYPCLGGNTYFRRYKKFSEYYTVLILLSSQCSRAYNPDFNVYPFYNNDECAIQF